MDRRTFLGGVGATAVAFAGCLGGGAGSDGYGDWFSDVDNYDGEVDRTGRESVTVRVGADDGFAFSPAAIVVDSGTTVRWAWTGKGGRHNVAEDGGGFTSPYYSSEGQTWTHDFEETGVVPYFCEPHRAQGMKGGVRVE